MPRGLRMARSNVGVGLQLAIATCVLLRQVWGAAIFLVPVSEYTLVWKEWRNLACTPASVWRPVLNPIDVGTGKNLTAILLGDIFMPNEGPPNFVATVLAVDDTLDACPPGYGCILATPETGQGVSVPPLFAKAEFPESSTVWDSKVAQCICANTTVNAAGVSSCVMNAASSVQPMLTLEETGYVRDQNQFVIKSPLCPTDYYVLGHVGTIDGVLPPANYQCIHKRLLRRAGNEDGSSLYKSSTPLSNATAAWMTDPNDKVSFLPEYAKPIAVYYPNCGFQGCPSLVAPDLSCDNDTISQGLFYAGTSPPMRITASKNPNDLANLAPAVGPRCLVHYRYCTDNCDSDLGTSSTGSPRSGLIYVKPWGAPLYAGDDGATYVTLQLYISSYMYAALVAKGLNPAGPFTYPSVAFNFYPPATARTQGLSRVWAVTVQQDYTILSVNVSFSTLQSVRVREGPALILLYNSDFTLLTTSSGFPLSRSIGKFYFYRRPDAAVLSPSVLYNGQGCVAPVLVQMPSYVNLMSYFNFDCRWKDDNTPSYRITSFTRLELAAVPRAILCIVPAKTLAVVSLRVSLNGQQYHTIIMNLTRVDPTPRSAPGAGALRMYSLVPRSGPAAGATQITVAGEFFSNYRNNNLRCRFQFTSGAGVDRVEVTAYYIDDRRLQCTSPPALNSISFADVTLAVDASSVYDASYCSAEVDVNNGKLYNSFQFFYTEESTTFIPNVAYEPPTVSWRKCSNSLQNISKLTSYPSPYQNTPAVTPVIDCRSMPNAPPGIAEHGWFACLEGLNPKNEHDISNPIWCLRAIPSNGARSYIFWMFDPFLNAHGYFLRVVPEMYPGFCNRNRLSLTMSVRIVFNTIIRLNPRPGQTLEAAWIAAQADATSTFSSIANVNGAVGYLRNTGDREVFVDWEIFTDLEYKEELLLTFETLRLNVAIGDPVYGRYLNSQVFLGTRQLRVLWMSESWGYEDSHFARWNLNLDYRRMDHTNPTIVAGGGNATKGKQMIEYLFSHRSLIYSDGRNISYMKSKLHAIGELYGFIALTTSAFFIEWDATLAMEYDDSFYRNQFRCNRTNNGDFKTYSGFFGDPTTYIDWMAESWSKGRPMCSLQGVGKCSKPPYTEPASFIKERIKEDKTLGCLRLRVGFNCTQFSLQRCMKEQVSRDNNLLASLQPKHAGTGTTYINDEGWCQAYYKTALDQTTRTTDYLYRRRLSPCVVCKQAEEICSALSVSNGYNANDDTRLNNGDLDYIAEIDLGCFAMAQTGGAVLDQCCDNACSSTCAQSLESCVRPKQHPVCASGGRKSTDSYTDCGSGTPICVPRTYVGM